MELSPRSGAQRRQEDENTVPLGLPRRLTLFIVQISAAITAVGTK